MLKGFRLGKKFFSPLKQPLPDVRSASSKSYANRLFCGNTKFSAGKMSLHPTFERTPRLLVSEIQEVFAKMLSYYLFRA